MKLLFLSLCLFCSVANAAGMLSLKGEVYSYDEKTVTLKVKNELFKVQRDGIDLTDLNSIERPGQKMVIQVDMNEIVSVSKVPPKK